MLREPGPRLPRCLHASTVPLAGEPADHADPDLEPEVEPHFWFPFYVECPPAVELHGEPREPQQEPGIQPLS